MASADHVHAVVVGSGFGGSVSAARLAEAGRAVVVLERGKAYPPGSFARTPAQMARNFWDPSEGLHGLFDLWSFRGLDGLVSSGLGGGSLIYANVLLRKDEKWFVHESPLPGGGYENWPISRADLEPHYDATEVGLGAALYPWTDTTPKTLAFREAAQARGLDWALTPLAVTFGDFPGQPLPEPTYGNVHDRPRRSCTLCGECDIGCNDGAKNTLDHTYLSRARTAGADLRTRCEVRGFAPLDGGGWEVRYVEHTPEAEGTPTDTRALPLRRLTCDRLILSAGTFGTPFLLLKNRAALPNLSDTIGQRFCGNGDLLTFALGAGSESSPNPLDPTRGPVITSAIRLGDELDGKGDKGRGAYIEDAGFPAFASWLVEATQLPGAAARAVRLGLQELKARLTNTPDSNLSAEVAALLGPAFLSHCSLPLLGMGRDVPDGRLMLSKGKLDAEWTTETSIEYFTRVRDTMAAVADELDATLVDNPLWWRKRVITVHPLGGAVMGRHVGESVCDSYGQVFGHPGLHVLDGSLLPGPVGANPSLTIAAVADRACSWILEQPTPARVPTAQSKVELAEAIAAAPGATSLSFTEEMKGYVCLGETDCAAGAKIGRVREQKLSFRLTISTDDVARFVSDPHHEGSAVGHVDCDALGGRLPVERGIFNLFVSDKGADGRPSRQMLYRLHLSDSGGNPLTLVGHKQVTDEPGLDVWPDTSTLYTTVYSGHVGPDGEAGAPVLAAGIITIHLGDFVQQLTTFRTHGPRGVWALGAFGRLFLGELWDVYGPRVHR